MPSGKLSSWKPTGKSWFLGIGINTYKEFPNLINAVRDVEKLAGVLVEYYDVDEACTVTLFDEKATEENILNQLDFLAAQIKSDDKLIIYYSGHGLVNNNLGKGYWLPHDAKKRSSARSILNSTIQDYVGGIQAKHILVISDACFSGSMFMRGTHRSIDFADELEERNSRWGLCSGRHDEEVYDGEPGDHSPFAQSLLNLLTTTNKSFIPVGQVVNHVIEQTASNYEQLPDGRPLYGVGHEGGQYVFRKKELSTSTSTTDESQNTSAHNNNNNKVESTNIVLNEEEGNKMMKLIALAFLGLFLIVGAIIVGVTYMSNENSKTTKQQFEMNGKTYSTLKIGSQQWMAGNMNTTLNGAKLYLLNNTDELTTNQLGQLYSYEDANKICQQIPGNEWRLPTAEDINVLASHVNYPTKGTTASSGYILPREFATALAPGGNTGLSFQLGGKYYIDSKEFSPSSWDKLNSGCYWLSQQRILNLVKYGPEYTLEITSTVPWNHACSCRCIKK